MRATKRGRKTDNRKTRKSNRNITYLIHDNGDRPFQVVVSKNIVSIYKGLKNEDGGYDNYDELVKKLIVHRVYPGQDSSEKGNTVLVHVGNHKYVYIGGEIYEFQMSDDFEAYYSAIGGNDVPYPILLGRKYVYLMLDRKYISRDLFPSRIGADAYEYYYGLKDLKTGEKTGHIRKMKGLKMKGVKILRKRFS
jgi:hypothetical protein